MSTDTAAPIRPRRFNATEVMRELPMLMLRYGMVAVLVLLTQTPVLSTLVRPVLRTFVSVGTSGLSEAP